MVNIVRSNLLDSKPLANTQSAQSPQVQQRPSIQQHAQPLLDPHKPQIAPSSAQLPQATQGKTPTKPKEQDTPQTQLQTSTSHSGTMNKPQLPPKVPTVAGPQKVSMEIKVKKGQDVSFDFDIVSDTPLNVAKEMVRELELNESYIAEIQKQIVQQIAKNGISPLPASLIQDSSLLNQLDKQQQHGIQPIVQTTHTPIQTNISGVQVQQQQQQSKSSVVGLSPSHHPTIPFFTSPPHITTPANTPMQQQPQPPHLSQHHSVLQTQQSTSQPHPTPATVQQLTFPTPNPQSGVLPTPNSTKTVLSIGKGDLSNAFHLYASFDGQPPRILLENCYISRTPQKGQAMQPYLILNHDIKYLHKYLDPEDQEFELLGGADISNAVAIGIQKDVFLQLTDQTGLSAKKHSAATGSLQPLISNNSTAGNNSLSLPQQKKAATLTKPIQKSDAGDMFQKLLSDIELFYNQMKQLGVENTEEIVDAMECSTEEKGIRFAFLNKVILAKREYKQLREAYKKSLAKQQQKVATSATMTLPTPQQETSTAAQSEQSEYLSAAKAQKQTSTQSQIVPSQQVDQSHKKTSMDNNKPPIIIQEDIKQQKITYTVPSYIRKQFKSSPQTIACSTKLSKHLKRRDPDDLSDIIDEEVRELQQLLNLLWHDSVYLHAKKADTSEKQKQILDSHIPLKVDGIFDEKTEKCVIKFQKFKELTQNGVVTDKIWSLMIQQADSIMAEDIKKQKSVVIQQNEMKPMPSSVHGGGSTKELKFQQITANGGGGNSQQQASNFQNIPQPGLQSASSISSSNKKQQSDQIKPSSTQQQLNASPSRMHRQSQQHIDYSMAIENLSKQQKQGVPQQMHSLPVVFLHPTGSQDSQFAQDINANLGSITSANSVKHVQIGGVPSQNKIYNQQMHVDEDEDC